VTGSRQILVLGATGQQGGAVARHLLTTGWQVLALTRDPGGAPALALERQGAQLVKGDMGDAAALDQALQGVHGVFSVQPAVSPGIADAREEEHRGRAVADAAQRAGVQHLVYSSVVGADAQSRFRYQPKWEIERHIRALDLPWTVLRPAGFMEDLIGPRFGVPAGRFTTAMTASTVWDLIAVDDIGAVAARVFGEPQRFVERTLDLAGDARTPPQIAEALSRAAGQQIPYVQIEMEVLRRQSAEVAQIFQWVNEERQRIDLAAVRAEHPGLLTLQGWLEQKPRIGNP
jgi:uncharacterized protein YbjT (DUF2867 family)